MGYLTRQAEWLVLFCGAVVCLFLSPEAFSGASHVIQFGGTLGLVYSPSSFSVAVGDTVRWEGDFTTHPLSSTSVPAGAATWHNGMGTVFDYVVTVPGSYDFHCDNHFLLGMVGSFSSVAAGVESQQVSTRPTSYRLDQNYPNPFNPTTTIEYALPSASHVVLKVYNLIGESVATLVDESRPAGIYRVRYNASGMPSGVYIYKLEAGDFTAAKKLVLLK